MALDDVCIKALEVAELADRAVGEYEAIALTYSRGKGWMAEVVYTDRSGNADHAATPQDAVKKLIGASVGQIETMLTTSRERLEQAQQLAAQARELLRTA